MEYTGKHSSEYHTKDTKYLMCYITEWSVKFKVMSCFLDLSLYQLNISVGCSLECLFAMSHI
jgi:hypothetical protein